MIYSVPAPSPLPPSFWPPRITVHCLGSVLMRLIAVISSNWNANRQHVFVHFLHVCMQTNDQGVVFIKWGSFWYQILLLLMPLIWVTAKLKLCTVIVIFYKRLFFYGVDLLVDLYRDLIVLLNFFIFLSTFLTKICYLPKSPLLLNDQLRYGVPNCSLGLFFLLYLWTLLNFFFFVIFWSYFWAGLGG